MPTNRLSLRARGVAVAAVVFVTAAQVWAGAVEAVNRNRQGVAAKGYDVMAYFQQGKPVQGSAQFFTAWMGATWWFATGQNRDLFQADTGRYAPQFGGYCS